MTNKKIKYNKESNKDIYIDEDIDINIEYKEDVIKGECINIEDIKECIDIEGINIEGINIEDINIEDMGCINIEDNEDINKEKYIDNTKNNDNDLDGIEHINCDIIDGTDRSYKSTYDTLVLSGGSVNTIMLLGALQYADDNLILNDIKSYVGVSAGAMCCYLLAIGYKPIEIIVELCTNQITENMKELNIYGMMKGNGATTFNHIHKQLEKMTIKKIGRLVTFKELRDITGKQFVCTSYNMTQNYLEILNYETHPDMPCLIALRMSSNLPIIFDKFEYLNNSYIDGAISSNFPIGIGETYGEKILGIVLYDMNIKNVDNVDNGNMTEYIYKLISIPNNQITKNEINNSSSKSYIVKIKPYKSNYFDFDIGTPNKLDMFSNGYKQMSDDYCAKQA